MDVVEHATTTTTTTSLWRSGDYAKLVVSALVLTFLGCICAHELGYASFFSASYRAQGFCVSNPGSHPAVQGHAISFYADAITAAGMLGLVHYGRRHLGMSEPSLRPIDKNALSLFGHGCGHLWLAFQTSTSTGGSHTRAFEELTPAGQAFAFAAFMFVWYGFMRDTTRSVPVTLAFALFHNVLQVFILPSRFFFTHVLMAVLLNSAFRGLSRPASDKKNKFYDMEAILVDIPILLASFGEALTCDSFLKAYGGHVWFDMVVPVMFTVYYAILVLTNDEDTFGTRKGGGQAGTRTEKVSGLDSRGLDSSIGGGGGGSGAGGGGGAGGGTGSWVKSGSNSSTGTEQRAKLD